MMSARPKTEAVKPPPPRKFMKIAKFLIQIIVHILHLSQFNTRIFFISFDTKLKNILKDFARIEYITR